MTDTPKHTPEIPPFSAEVAATALRMWTCYYALAGIADPAAFVARAKAIEEAAKHALARSRTEKNDHVHAPQTLHWIANEIETALALPGGTPQ